MPTTPPTTEEAFAMALLERMYAPLIKKLNLTPEQSATFYQLILDNKKRGQAQMTDLLRHEDPSRVARAVAEFQKETDASLRVLLGDADFAAYEEYQTSVGDRGMLELTKGDFAESPLTEEQTEHLLKAMESGRKAFANSTGGNAVVFSIADTTDVMNEKLGRQESIDRHVLQLAAGFLSPDQLKFLGSAQARMMDARKKGYEIARAMYGDPRGQTE